MTPEGKIKASINRVLDKYKDAYIFMPVPSGYGPSSLDYLICFHGQFIGIEAKAPGKKPSPRQRFVIGVIERAGGRVLVVDGKQGLEELELILSEVRCEACNPYK